MKFPRFSISEKLRVVARAAKAWLLLSLRIQLVLFLVALPILSLWGLPLSYASIVGNLFFAPWATVFLGLSTLWLISHLCGIPTFPIICCLERVADWWIWCLSWGTPSMLFAIPANNPFVVACIPLTACILLYSGLRARLGLHYEVLALSLLAVTWCGVLTKCATSTLPIPISHGGGNLWLCPDKNGISLVDNKGVLRALSPSSSWIKFSLAPTLARHFGACTCNDIVLFKPTVPRLHAAASLIRAGKAQALIVPQWIMQKKWWGEWSKKHEDIVAKGIDERALIAHYGYLETS